MADEPGGFERAVGSRREVRSLRWRLQRGQAMALIALMMTALVGFTALAVDAGFAYQGTRQLQTVSDAAALSAAIHLLRSNSDCSNITTTVPSVIAVATKYVGNNGFSPTLDATVGISVTCPYQGDNRRVRVQVSRQLQAYFSGPVFGALFVPNVSSVGVVTATDPPAPFMALEEGCGANPGVYSHGSGTTQVWAGAIHSNPSCADSIKTWGSGTISSTATINSSGGCVGGGITPACRTNVPVQPDPLALDLQTKPPCTSGSPGSYTLAGCTDYTWGISGSGSAYAGKVVQDWSGNPTVAINPGVYYGIEPKNATVWLKPGIYIMKGGGFEWTGNGDIRVCQNASQGGGLCGGLDYTTIITGVMIFNTTYGYPQHWPTSCPDPPPPAGNNTGDAVDISGDGAFNLLPPQSGPYQGMGIWQDRCVTNAMKLWGSSDGTTISGTVYAPTAQIQIGGNGTFSSSGTIYAATFDVSGSGTVQITYNSGGSYNPIVATLIE